MTYHIIPNHWAGKDPLTGRSTAWFKRQLAESSASSAAKAAAVRLCRAYTLTDPTDPAYIAHIIQREIDRAIS